MARFFFWLIMIYATFVAYEVNAQEIPQVPSMEEMESWEPDGNQVLGVIVTFTVDSQLIQFAYPIQSTEMREPDCPLIDIGPDSVSLFTTPMLYIISPEPTMYRIGNGPEDDWQSMIEKTYFPE